MLKKNQKHKEVVHYDSLKISLFIYVQLLIIHTQEEREVEIDG